MLVIDERYQHLVERYSEKYRNAAEGFMVSVKVFDEVPESKVGILFDYIMDYASRRIGTQVMVGKAPKDFIRFLPKIPRPELILLGPNEH